MADSAVRRATYQDVLDAPANKVAELVDGVLHVSPRPAKPHALASSALGGELIPPFRRGRGGPGGEQRAPLASSAAIMPDDPAPA